MTADNIIDKSGSLSGIDAISWVMNYVWKKDQAAFSKLSFLDIIIFEKDSSISGWWFTSSDGLLKSKTKSKWNSSNIIERYKQFEERPKNGHYWLESEAGWRWLNCDDIKSMLENPGGRGCFVLYSHVLGNVSFLEEIWESAIPKPKHTTLFFCDRKAKGKLASSDIGLALPSGRVSSLNKIKHNAFRNIVSELVRCLEQRSNRRILKINVVLAVEESSMASSTQEKKVWIHHVDSLVLGEEIEQSKSTGLSPQVLEMMEKRSNARSHISNSSSSFHRLEKCMGDFCSFSAADEADAFFYDEEDGDVLSEIHKARHRHKRNDDVDNDNKDDNLSDLFGSNALNDDRNNNFDEQLLHDVDEHSNSKGGLLKGNNHNNTSSKSNQSILQSEAVRIQCKSIALARQEMEIIDRQEAFSAELCPWPLSLYQWWHRMGKSLISKGHVGGMVVPPLAGDKIGEAVLNQKNLSIHKETQGGLEKDSAVVASAIHANSNGNNNLGMDDNDLLDGKEFETESDISTIEPSLMISKKTAGHLSRYYSEAQVCSHCYQVYRDLDRRRKEKQRSQFKELASLKEEQENKNVKQLEKKMFEQRRLVSRLTVPKHPRKLKPLKGGLPGIPSSSSSYYYYGDGIADETPFQASYMSSISKVPYGEMMMGSSMLEGPSMMTMTMVGGGGGSGSGNSNYLAENNIGGSNMAPPPSCALVPQPWQLSNESLRERYEMQGSAFIRNIKQKAQSVVEAVATQQAMNKYSNMSQDLCPEDILMGKKSLSNNEYDTNQKHEFQWKVATGQINPIQVRPPRDIQKKTKAIKVPKKFDAERLLHPWQRDMQRMRDANRIVTSKSASQLNKNSNSSNSNSNSDNDIDDDDNNRANLSQYRPLPPIPSAVHSNSLSDLHQASYFSLSEKSRGLNEYSENMDEEDDEDDSKLMERFSKLNNLQQSSRQSVSKLESNSIMSINSKKSVTFDSSLVEIGTLSGKSRHEDTSMNGDHDYEEDDDDDGDEGIGWSPFVIPTDN